MTTFRNLSQDKNFVRAALITLAIIFGLRIFYSISVPGINADYFKSLMDSNAALGLLDIFTGNGLSNISVMMLNITPYITASIVIQLLSTVFQKLKDMKKGLKDEQKKLEHITILVGVGFAVIEGIAMAIGFGRKGLFIEYTWYWVAIAVAIWALGTAAASFLGKMIQDKYKFNGVSLILVANILASYLSDGTVLYSVFAKGKSIPNQILAIAIIIIIILALFIFTYFVQDSEKTIYTQHATKNVYGNNRQKSEIPIKLCPGSVVPIIFASSLMMTPAMIASAFGITDAFWVKLLSSNYWFNPNDMLPSLGVIIYILLIFGFSIYYANLTLDAKEIAENLKKNNGVITGIRPGKSTEEYLKTRIVNTAILGAFALIIIALIPIILSGIFNLSRISFLGTSVIIVVGVIVELKKKITLEATKGNYLVKAKKGFLL